MKKIYLLTAFVMAALVSFAQDTTTHSLTAYVVNDTLIYVEADYSKNCPEAGTGLTGIDSVGFHSGANQWAAVVAADSSAALAGLNDGSDRFRLLINPKEYYGVDFASLDNIFFVMNNYFADPGAPWTNAMRDSLNGGFGGTEPCGDMRIYMDEVDPLPATSLNVSGCKDIENGTVQIKYNYNRNCIDAGTGLAGVDTIGFHSGANTWSSVVAWDDAGARVATNNGLDTFTVVVETQSYYGVPLDSLDNIMMVFNNGPNDAANPWAMEGKDRVIDPSSGSCQDIRLEIAELPECTEAVLGIQDHQLEIGLKVAPNPFGDVTNVTFSNLNREKLTGQLTNINGQIVRDFGVLNGTNLQIHRENLASGMYFLTIRNEEGKIAMEKLMLK